jgi:hypothetical protein
VLNSALVPNLYIASYVPMPWGHVDTDVFAAWGQWAGGSAASPLSSPRCTSPSATPAFETVFVTIGDQTFERWALRERTSGPIQVASVIGPGESEPITRIRFDVTNDYDARADWTYTVTFSFQDADGLRWRSIGNGPPARVLERRPGTEGR